MALNMHPLRVEQFALITSLFMQRILKRLSQYISKQKQRLERFTFAVKSISVQKHHVLGKKTRSKILLHIFHSKPGGHVDA